MTIETQLYTRLSTGAALIALVGDRIYPNQAPQNVASPWLTYQRMSTDQVRAMGSDTGLKAAPFQISSWHADEFLAARLVADQVALRLVGSRSQAVLPWTDLAAPIPVERAFLENDLDIPDRQTDRITYRIVQDFLIHFIE